MIELSLGLLGWLLASAGAALLIQVVVVCRTDRTGMMPGTVAVVTLCGLTTFLVGMRLAVEPLVGLLMR